MKHVPLHELEREVLKMPSGDIVNNPDYRRSVATVDIKHDLSVKWYGAQFHVSDHRLIVDWLNEIIKTGYAVTEIGGVYVPVIVADGSGAEYDSKKKLFTYSVTVQISNEQEGVL